MRAVTALCLCLLAPLPLAAQARSRVTRDAIYAYTDDRGQLIYADQLADVPEALRPHARRVDYGSPEPDRSLIEAVQSLLGSRPEASASQPRLYRYRGHEGRAVFTNLPESVPLEQRGSAEIDLSHVSLHSELGQALDHQLEAAHQRLVAAPFCPAIRTRLEEPLWERAWREHGPLVVCGGALLLALLITPWISGKVGGAAWARVLSFAIPALGLAGVAALVLTRTASSGRALLERAAPCDPKAWAAASGSPQPLASHLQLVKKLQSEVATLEQIHAESR